MGSGSTVTNRIHRDTIIEVALNLFHYDAAKLQSITIINNSFLDGNKQNWRGKVTISLSQCSFGQQKSVSGI